MANNKPTEDGKQSRALILAFLKEFKKSHGGQSPSYREVSKGVGLALSATAYHLNVMNSQGMISLDQGKSRHIGIPGEIWVPPTN